MLTALIILNVILLFMAGYLFYKNRKDTSRSEKLFSDLEDMDLIEFQQNLKALIGELSRVAKTNVASMEEKKAETELVIKSADVRISEIKYLLERNQLKRQAEYKEAINSPAETKAPVLPFEAPGPVKDVPGMSRMLITGMEDTADAVPAQEAPAPAKDKYQHINSLIKNGLSIEEIAKVTGLTRGEIELVRNIKK